MSEQEIQNIVQMNTALRNENAILKEQLALLQEQYDWLKKQVFGRKSEQTSVIMDGGTQLSLFPEEKEQAVPSVVETVSVPAHQRKKKRTHEEWMSSLPVEEVRHEEEQPVCEKCGSEMKEIGEEKVYDELVYTPAKFHVRRHIAKKYKCVNCGEHPESSTEPCRIRLAEYPKPMIPHSFCSPALMAHVVYEKYVKGIPLHRQEKDFISKGISLSKATLSSWVGIAAQQWGLPIVQEMHKRLLVLNIIHGDETTVQVLHEEGRKPTTVSRMWVYANGKMNDYSIIIFEYQPTRGGEHPAAFLKDFHGYLICDGYDAYNAVTGAKRCGCWMHTRRYFVEALPKDKAAYETSVAAKAVEFCNRIYHEEGLLAELTPEERYEQRLVKVKPLLDAFFAWLEEQNVSGKGKLAKAVNYALNEKKYLCTFLEDGNVPIDNNRAENAIRPFAVGRRNWLFSNTANGAKSSAIWYSILSTAQANGLDAEKYLIDLFSHPPGTILLPWNES
ncbi:MAG: IS66 family transposase [Oscillospiraceae bacterium]|nr:IS66 family transposase [Oscillospiraceae bacterium]